MTTHPYTPLPINDNGSVLLTPCPGTKDVEIFESVKQLSDAGARIIVTLMSDEELEANNASNLGKVCADSNVEWLQMPVMDNQAPDKNFSQKWNENKSKILDALSKGENVAVHCKGGSGRTGLITCQILMSSGVPMLDAYDMVKEVRPKALSKTPHRRYIEAIA